MLSKNHNYYPFKSLVDLFAQNFTVPDPFFIRVMALYDPIKEEAVQNASNPEHGPIFPPGTLKRAQNSSDMLYRLPHHLETLDQLSYQLIR